MKLALAIAALALVGAAARAHCNDIEGEILLSDIDTGAVALVETIAPGTVPNGLFYYTIHDLKGGDEFWLEAKNPGMLMVGLANECPGPTWRGPMVNAVARGDVPGALSHAQNAWLVCNHYPDFDVKFTGGDYTNGPGDETGTVPGAGVAVIVLVFGPPKSGFIWHQGSNSCPSPAG